MLSQGSLSPPGGGYPAGGPNTGTAWGPYWWVRDTVELCEEARGERPGSGWLGRKRWRRRGTRRGEGLVPASSWPWPAPTSAVCPVLSLIPFLAPPSARAVAHMPVGGVQVQQLRWDTGPLCPGDSGWRTRGSSWAVAELGCRRDPPHTPVCTSPWHKFTSTHRRGEQDETGDAAQVCTVCLPPPRMVGHTRGCWNPTFSPATGQTHGQRDPARLSQQARQRLAGAASRALAPGKHLPGRGTLRSPEHRASNSTPASALCHAGRREQGAAGRTSGVRHCTARVQGSSASPGCAAPTLPGQKHRQAPWDTARANSLAWHSGPTVPTLWPAPGAAGRRAEARHWATDFGRTTPPSSPGHACPNGQAGRSPRGQPGQADAALCVHHHHPKVHAIPPACSQECPKAAAIAFGQHSLAEGQPGAGSPHPEPPNPATLVMLPHPKPATSAPFSPWPGTRVGIYQPRRRRSSTTHSPGKAPPRKPPSCTRWRTGQGLPAAHPLPAPPAGPGAAHRAGSSRCQPTGTPRDGAQLLENQRPNFSNGILRQAEIS